MSSVKKQPLLIVFEGTDGAGKSTIARATYDKISESVPDFKFIDKNRPPVTSGYSEFHMGRIRDILWEYPDDAPLEQLGDRHWLSLIVAWFQATDHAVVRPAIESGISCISDGWYYKYLARFLLKDPILAGEAMAFFSTVRRPDVVIFLDVDPVISADRKGAFRLSESGAYDGGGEDRLKSFVEYQKKSGPVMRHVV
ncbi:dTMP kinase [Pseudomonas asplenii]|uniref:dTMP kinase n=1 Tax=Pseudomonas asplenii TaxID=53407 RepID=UPI0006CCE512|nr:thymidylate kinase [Pseudomonas fuscovaginae]KPA97281.1 thymidylate kinase [Pseudomonas fuscovaginae]